MKLAEPEVLIPDQDDAPTAEEVDECIGTEVILPRGDEYQHEKVFHRKA